jgi:Domain of unknown function (DUF4185)
MNTPHRFAILIVILAAAAGTLPAGTHAQNLSLSGSSTKVCQLIGDTDWDTGKPTNAKTKTNWKLQGVDLGFPVDTGSPGKLYFLFGDAIPNGHPANSIASGPPDDAFGFTSRTAAPDSKSCLELQLVASSAKQFLSPVVRPVIQQGSFNVPSGGAFVGSTLYAFFWTDHCVSPALLTPNPGSPLDRPPPSALCSETPLSSSLGQSVLAQAALAKPTSFTWTPPSGEDALLFTNMPSGFVYATAAADATSQPVTVTVSPTQTVIGYPVFGVVRYRASIPYLAIAPTATFGNPATWIFFTGTAESPVWLTRQQWEAGSNSAGEWIPPSNGAEIYAAQPAAERCVGEHSVTYNKPLGVWLMLYNCASTIEARSAPQPWGPWSLPFVLLNAVQDPNVVCTLIQNESKTGCSGKPAPVGAGGFYAPFVLNRFTQGQLPTLGATYVTIYWLVSTWNPYTVVVMQSTLQAGSPIVIPPLP